MTLANDYAKELRRELKMFPVWPPEIPVRLGDYGTLDGSIFQRRGNITDDFGVQIEALPDAERRDIEYKSAGKVSVEVNAGASAGVPGAQGTVSKRVTFSKAHSALLSASNCTYEVFKNVGHIESTLLELLGAGTWQKEWAVISGVVRSESATILVSSQKNASIDLVLEGEIPQVQLAGANLKVSINAESNVGVKVLAKSGATPLMMLSRVQTRYAPFWPIPRGHVLRVLGGPVASLPVEPTISAPEPQLMHIDPWPHDPDAEPTPDDAG